MIGVFIIPTGIGCDIGGFCGDSTPSAKLISSCCDKLIVHPNVVNGASINEMTENMLYVEGSILDRVLEGKIGLSEIRYNKILLVINAPLTKETINVVLSCNATIGTDIEIVELNTPLKMNAEIIEGIATGKAKGVEELIVQVRKEKYDALAIHTPITCDRNTALNYYRNGGVNPWGGIEAYVSRKIANAINKPVAHAPTENTPKEDVELYYIHERECLNKRIAPEAISLNYLFCVIKGLHKSPQIGRQIINKDIDFLVSPINCYGRPHIACLKNGITIIAVKENNCVLNNKMPEEVIIAETYLEATGIVSAMKAGINYKTVGL